MPGNGRNGAPCIFRRHQHIAREGESQSLVYRFDEGWACRYRRLGDGRRQITALFLPGDYCEPQWLIGGKATDPVVALTWIRAMGIPLEQTGTAQGCAAGGVPPILDALLRTIEQQAEWIVSLGRKSATERICGLICDLFSRLQAANRLFGNACMMPLTQYDMADVVGLTPVHVNRVIKTLRGDGLIEWKAPWLRVSDMKALRRAAALPENPARPYRPGAAPAEAAGDPAPACPPSHAAMA